MCFRSHKMYSLFFVDNVSNIDCHGTLPKIADHEGIVVSFNLNVQKQKVKTRKVYDYQNADINGLITYIKSLNFEGFHKSCQYSKIAEYLV